MFFLFCIVNSFIHYIAIQCLLTSCQANTWCHPQNHLIDVHVSFVLTVTIQSWSHCRFIFPHIILSCCCTQRLLLCDAVAFSISQGFCLWPLWKLCSDLWWNWDGLHHFHQCILFLKRMVVLNLYKIEIICLELDCTFFNWHICSIWGTGLLKCYSLYGLSMKAPKLMVHVDGDKSWLRLLFTCALPGLFDIACCSRMGFVAQTWAITIVWWSCATIWWQVYRVVIVISCGGVLESVMDELCCTYLTHGHQSLIMIMSAMVLGLAG